MVIVMNGLQVAIVNHHNCDWQHFRRIVNDNSTVVNKTASPMFTMMVVTSELINGFVVSSWWLLMAYCGSFDGSLPIKWSLNEYQLIRHQSHLAVYNQQLVSTVYCFVLAANSQWLMTLLVVDDWKVEGLSITHEMEHCNQWYRWKWWSRIWQTALLIENSEGI